MKSLTVLLLTHAAVAPPNSAGFPPSQTSPQFPPPNFSYPPPPSHQRTHSNAEFPPPPPSTSPPLSVVNATQFAANQAIPLKLSPSATPPAQAEPSNQLAGASRTTDDVGTFNGGSYRISHRDTNSVLTIQLAMGCPLEAKPGAMIAVSTSMQLKGAFKPSFRKLIARGQMSASHYTGPGELLLAPTVLGDILALRLTGSETWKVGKDGYLASTCGIEKDYKGQGLTKGLLSGEGFFVYEMTGVGILWLQSFGAIIQKDIPEGESYLIDNGHLVAWNCKYEMRSVASGGLMSTFAASEGVACRFTGPGTVYLQTRNLHTFGAQIGASTASG